MHRHFFAVSLFLPFEAIHSPVEAKKLAVQTGDKIKKINDRHRV